MKSKRPLIAVGVLALVAVGGVLWQREMTRRWKWEPIVMQDKMARVPVQWPVATLAERLQKSGKVRDRETFLEAAAQVGLKQVSAGGYVLPLKAGPLDLANIFKKRPDFIKVTFPEGWTAEKMAQRLAANDFPAAAAFRKLAYPPGQPVSPLEGTLFPDTYQMPVRGTAPQIVAVLRARFAKAMKGLPPKLPPVYDGKPLTQHELVTLASLVERETDVAAERPLIAGVLINRLNKNMRLQCDATVQYVRERAFAAGKLDKGHKQRLLWSDLKLDSTYNTYRHKGLPPGPICNPGEPALRAAASPKASPYFFYVMSPRLKRHLFAVTFEEHLRNIAIVKKERSN